MSVLSETQVIEIQVECFGTRVLQLKNYPLKPEVVQLLTGDVRLALQSKERLVDSIVVLSACGGSPGEGTEPLRFPDRAVLWIDAVGVERATGRVDMNARMPTGHVQHEATTFARSAGSGRWYLVGFSTSGFTAEEK